MPDRTKFELDYRPQSYWVFRDAKQQVQATVKGAVRRSFVELFEKDVGDEIRENDFLTTPGIAGQEREAWGRVHPAFLGGEFLPDLEENEVEIARMTLESVTRDVISIRARRRGDRIHYAIHDEYEELWKFRFSPKTSRDPLSMNEIIGLVNSIEKIEIDDELSIGPRPDSGFPSFTGWLFGPNLDGGASPEELRNFVTVSSAFYSELEPWYGAVCDEWYERVLADRLEPCCHCGDLLDPCSDDDCDHECPEGIEYDRIQLDQAKLEEERRATLITPFLGHIRRVVDNWKRLHPGGGRSFHARAGSLERYLEDYVVVHGSMPTGVHDVKYRFMSTTPHSLQVNFDTLVE